MHKLASIFFIIALLAQFVVKLGVEVHFVLNQEEIIEAFCVNKDAPEMQCNGKCYLKKQLEKVEQTSNGEQDDQSDNKRSTKRNQSPEFSEEGERINITYFPLEERKQKIAHKERKYFYLSTSDLFHPPQCLGYPLG